VTDTPARIWLAHSFRLPGPPIVIQEHPDELAPAAQRVETFRSWEGWEVTGPFVYVNPETAEALHDEFALCPASTTDPEEPADNCVRYLDREDAEIVRDRLADDGYYMTIFRRQATDWKEV
jgi:hypothetical protein